MAILINFAGASIGSPGSYTDVQPAGGTVSTPAVGTVALIGEADAGLPYVLEKGLSSVSFGPDEYQLIKDKYRSGALLDAAKLVISPSNDPQIKGGAQELVLLKTNQSTQATLGLLKGASAYGTVADKLWGAAGNHLAYQCSLTGGKATITVSNLDTGKSEVSAPLGLNALMSIQVTDVTVTAATMTISQTALTTTITGGTTTLALNVPLAQFTTVAKLCAFISSKPGYTATPAATSQGVKSTTRLDNVTGVDIKTAAYSVNQDAAEVRDFFAQSALVNFTPVMYSGLPSAAPKAHLNGGALGATSPADILNCFDALLKRRVNFIVPLFSRSAAADIADNLTDAASTYDIDSVHAAASSHVNVASTVKGRKERQAWVGYKGTFLDTVEKAAVLNSNRVSLCFQDVDVLGADGLVDSSQPHMLAAIAAGMHAAAPIGLSTTFKAPQISGFTHVDFDAETMAEQAIAANLTFVEKSPNGGFRFKLDNSTFAAPDNAWIYNRPSVQFAADFAAFAIRLSTEGFVGQRNSDVTVETIKNLLVSVFDSLRTLGVIVGDNNTGGKGYKDLTIKLEGSIVRVGVTLVLVENYEFILSEIRVQRAG